MTSHLQRVLADKSNQLRLLKIMHVTLGVLFVSYSIALLFHEPRYFWVVVLLVILAVLFGAFIGGTEPDANQPDGGESAAKANGFIFFVLIAIVGGLAALLFISVLITTEYLALSLGYAAVSAACGLVLVHGERWSAKIFPALWRVEYKCGICELEMYQDGHYRCPVCDFVSKGKKRFGLKQHLTKSHSETLEAINLFKSVCESCQSRDN